MDQWNRGTGRSARAVCDAGTIICSLVSRPIWATDNGIFQTFLKFAGLEVARSSASLREPDACDMQGTRSGEHRFHAISLGREPVDVPYPVRTESGDLAKRDNDRWFIAGLNEDSGPGIGNRDRMKAVRPEIAAHRGEVRENGTAKLEVGEEK